MHVFYIHCINTPIFNEQMSYLTLPYYFSHHTKNIQESQYLILAVEENKMISTIWHANMCHIYKRHYPKSNIHLKLFYMKQEILNHQSN